MDHLAGRRLRSLPVDPVLPRSVQPRTASAELQSNQQRGSGSPGPGSGVPPTRVARLPVPGVARARVARGWRGLPVPGVAPGIAGCPGHRTSAHRRRRGSLPGASRFKATRADPGGARGRERPGKGSSCDDNRSFGADRRGRAGPSGSNERSSLNEDQRDEEDAEDQLGVGGRPHCRRCDAVLDPGRFRRRPDEPAMRVPHRSARH